MNVDFTDGDIDKLVMWPETTGKVTPLYLARRTSYILPKFRWYGPLRPMEPMEVFDYPAEMADLARQNILGSMSKDAMTMRGQALGKPMAVPKGALIPGLQQPVEEDESLPTTPPDDQALPAESSDPSDPTDTPDNSDTSDTSDKSDTTDTPDTPDDDSGSVGSSETTETVDDTEEEEVEP